MPNVRFRLVHSGTQQVFWCETNYTGACVFRNLPPGQYQLRAEKLGFYAFEQAIPVAQDASVEVALHHVQEYHEEINVVDSPPAIDPTRTVQAQHLTNREIFSLPYPTTRDYRNVLPFLPGVIQDPNLQIHVGGSASYQVLYLLDGFNMTQPASGLLEMRVSPDAIRLIDVQSSRHSAEFGKGSGGVLRLETAMGDDRYRFSATNFVPGFDFKNGVSLDNWNWSPRLTFSGPFHRGKAWFLEGLGGEYDKGTVVELPPGQNVTKAWRMSSLSRAQVNLTPSNVLTANLLVNEACAGEVGLSVFTPLEATFRQPQSAFLASLKDSAYLPGGLLLELGVGVNQFRTEEQPRGEGQYVLLPEGARGSFYRTSRSNARRVQGLANLYLPPLHWHGRHDFKLGTDIDAIRYDQATVRMPILVKREDDTLARSITFAGPPQFFSNNFELGGFAQDRWLVIDRWVVEAGVRFDRDHVVRREVTSPRLATAYMLNSRTKINAGIGIFTDATNLAIVTRPLAGERIDQFFSSDGVTPLSPPVPTVFLPNQQPLQAPRFVNWSIGVERELPAAIHLEVEYLQKRGHDGFTFVNQAASATAGTFVLANAQRDHFDSVRFTARKQFKGTYELLGSYMRSSARSNAVLDFNLDNPIFAVQSGGPLPWDAPNRFISWGWMPLAWLPHMQKFDLAYSTEYHTGFPFTVVNQFQQIVGPPDSLRFPSYFTLNLHLERRFHLHGYEWALRAGFNNLTGHSNPTAVNNNIDAPDFLTFAGLQHRSFTGRIRFLGRK